MKSIKKNKTAYKIQFCVLMVFGVLFVNCSNSKILLENDYFKYVIASDGTNLKFVDKMSGINYLDTEKSTKCASISMDGIEYSVSALSFEDNQLTMEFGETGVSVKLEVNQSVDRITLIVVSVAGNIESLTFLNVPLTLEGQPYEPFAACVLSMNIFTHVRLLPPLQTKLWAKCYKRFGIEGAEVTLLGLPHEKMLPVIRDVMSNAKDVPFSDEGGAWALMKDKGYGSYLMNFGTLTEETVDEWIETCHRIGFNQIDSHGGGSFFEFGTFDLNKEKWPDGWDSFKRINARLHAAGISHIFHTYAFFIEKSSSYVTPVPSKDLGYARIFTLAEPLNEMADEIVVKESTANISSTFLAENSLTLRIGDEFVEFSKVTQSSPYKFSGLKRGVNGTKPSSHNVNEKVFHINERFGMYIPGPETELFNEMAHRHAEIVNHCEFDGIYFDAIDGSDELGGEENFWYYGTKFIFEIAKHLQRPVGMEMSSMSHHWWHYRSRWQAWDRPVRGYKRFLDIHLASIKASALFLQEEIKSKEWEHGRWPGHTPLIDKYAGVDKGQIMLPLHLGWWGNQAWAPPQIEPTFSDDIEYLGCKMIGNNAGFSQLGEVDKNTLEKIPIYKQATEIIKQYETLRQKNYFGEEVKKLLRQPGKDYTLFQTVNGDWNFKPITYQKHKIAGLNHPTATWTIVNQFDDQPVKLRIEALMSVKPYDDPSNIVLTDCSDYADFVIKSNATGVSGQLTAADEKTATGEPSMAYVSKNAGEAPQDGSYINMEKKYNPLLDISKNQALGVWIKGDGNGQILNLSLRTPLILSYNGAHGDHFVKIDFTGWQYFELVEIESSKISDYIWANDSHFYVYDSYRHEIQFRSIESLQFWYNNLPKGREVKTVIGPVKAIPMIAGTIENPSVTIAGEKIVFPVKMESGMYLEFRSLSDCKLYGSKGELLEEVKPQGAVPELKKGNNAILFSGEGSEKYKTRLQVTVISEGAPLDVR